MAYAHALADEYLARFAKFKVTANMQSRGIPIMSRRLSVKIPRDYRTKFERKNKEYNLGYSSFPEFIKDCMRRRFEEVEVEHEKQ